MNKKEKKAYLWSSEVKGVKGEKNQIAANMPQASLQWLVQTAL